ncbi:hypothetical protein Tsubulata_030312 [Turnera subulata]|uniref:Tryptophan synthase n=1 Tax=Turnera subulata TaxID=218843 RepID=A0A9Q0F2S7_9ROSI|nr:hypothetical protein Tsubulata_030312 [Turnera subulata]
MDCIARNTIFNSQFPHNLCPAPHAHVITANREICNARIVSVRVNGQEAMTEDTSRSKTMPLVVDRPAMKREIIPLKKLELRKFGGDDQYVLPRQGKFGRYGGMYVPETLVACLSKLEAELHDVLQDPQFQVCLL